MERKQGLLALDSIDYDLGYNVDIHDAKSKTFDKAQRLRFGESLMTHAMVFTGVDLDEKGGARRWRVENSWGMSLSRFMIG